MKNLLLPLGAGLAALTVAPPSHALHAATGTPLATHLVPGPAQDSEFGEPLTVNGKRISDMAIKRYLVYGPGKLALDARKLQILMDHERKIRVGEVRDEVLAENPEISDAELEVKVEARMKDFEYDPEVVERRLEKERSSFAERYPTLDYQTELRRAYRSGSWYVDQVRQTTEFDQLFFPGHPDKWPALSVEAIHQGSPEVDLVDDYRTHYERRAQIAADTGQPIEPEQDMMMSILRDFVMRALWSLADVKTATQGIPEKYAMIIDGDDWRAEVLTEDVYDSMKDSFSQADIEDAKLALALMEAARQKLEASGHLIPQEDFEQTVATMREETQDTMFNMDFLALQGHGFPSSQAYEEHMRLKDSFRNMIKDEIQPDENGNLPQDLLDHMPVANGIMGLAMADVNIVLSSAFDFPNYTWKENGWDSAYERAMKLRSEADDYLVALAKQEEAQRMAVETGGDFEPDPDLLPFDQWWVQFLRSNSEYWDPPLPAVGKSPPAYGLKNFGAFQDRPMTRNDLKRAIGESEYTHFLGNTAVVDRIFFEMEPGTIAGPFEGPHGYYIVYLRSLRAPTKPLNPRKEDHLGMIQEDWVRVAFRDFCHRALDEAEVTGL